jgi:hypothetical protein
MEITRDGIKKYFKDKANIVIFIILLAVCAYAIIIRFKNIGVLSYWGDDGNTFLGTFGILNYGYPKLPSGSIFYQTIFHFYLRIIPSLIFGINEVALRFPSAFFGTLVIPLLFIFIKDLLNNKYIALAVSIIVSFNAWQIEFSREIRYYSEYQFFYLLSIYSFYRGYFKEDKKFKIAALVFIFLTTLINGQGFTLVLLFIPLIIYKKFKGFFKKDIIISFFIVVAMIVGQIIHRELFWKAGVDFHPANITPGNNNPLLEIISKYFSAYTPFYHRIFGELFPKMYYLVFFGIILIILYLFIPRIRNNEENFVNIYSNSNYSIKLPFNLAFLYFIFYSNTVFNGLSFMANQQRYIYQAGPIFIAIYFYIIFDIGRLASTVFGNAIIGGNEAKIQGNNKSQSPRKDMLPDNYPFYLKKSVYFITTAIIFFLTVSWANPISNFKIAYRNNGDPVVSEFAQSNAFSFHYDIKTPGQYIYEHKNTGDIVIATDLFSSYAYTRQIDYWLWTGALENWQSDIFKDGKIYDEFFGVVPLITDLNQLHKVLNNNPDKNIWLVTSDSIRVPSQIAPDVAEFINSQEQYRKVVGKDGISAAYLFPKIDQPTRGFSFTATKENIINVKIVGNNPFVIGFGNKKNQPYLKYGWSEMEPGGTWADREYSVLFFNFKEKQDYTITIDAMALFDPGKKQEMKIIFNDIEVGNMTFQDANIKQYLFEIKKDLIKTDGNNILEFNYKYQLSPKSLGISSDSRNLSVYFKRIAIQKNNS